VQNGRKGYDAGWLGADISSRRLLAWREMRCCRKMGNVWLPKLLRNPSAIVCNRHRNYPVLLADRSASHAPAGSQAKILKDGCRWWPAMHKPDSKPPLPQALTICRVGKCD
jgi:hypothetical protein